MIQMDNVLPCSIQSLLLEVLSKCFLEVDLEFCPTHLLNHNLHFKRIPWICTLAVFSEGVVRRPGPQRDVDFGVTRGVCGTQLASASGYSCCGPAWMPCVLRGAAAARQIRSRTHLTNTVDNSWVIVF